MLLPNTADAVIDDAKVRDYLLSYEHPIGRAKARFFNALGFRRADWPLLHAALLELARTGEATATTPSPFGQPYLVRGILKGSAGRMAPVTSVWLQRSHESVPRFVTAYPTRP